MIELRIAAVVAVGAGLGGVLRLLVTQVVVGRFGVSSAFYATLFINLSGSFLIGLVLETAQLRASVHPLWRYFLATGVLGGYTTFSTFSFEAYALLSGGGSVAGALYVTSSVGFGILAALLGIVTGRALIR